MTKTDGLPSWSCQSRWAWGVREVDSQYICNKGSRVRESKVKWVGGAKRMGGKGCVLMHTVRGDFSSETMFDRGHREQTLTTYV